MTGSDKRLKAFMEKNSSFFSMMAPEFADEFYKLVREQALDDVADYLTRFGNQVFHKTRKAEPGLARRLRQLFYGAAHTIRTNGATGREQVEEMVAAMKAAPDAFGKSVDAVQYEVLDEEDGSPA